MFCISDNLIFRASCLFVNHLGVKSLIHIVICSRHNTVLHSPTLLHPAVSSPPPHHVTPRRVVLRQHWHSIRQLKRHRRRLHAFSSIDPQPFLCIFPAHFSRANNNSSGHYCDGCSAAIGCFYSAVSSSKTLENALMWGQNLGKGACCSNEM